ncbi:MAG: glycosyltransferase family 4 protein [Candidatus Sumerlaeota bacterium]
MVDILPEILLFSPSNPLRTPVSDYARSYLSAIQGHKGMTATSILSGVIPERLDGQEDSIQWVKRMTGMVMKAHHAHPTQVLHGHIGLGTKREFWALKKAGQMLPRAPVCLTFHDPPELPQPVLPPDGSQKRGLIERSLLNLSSRLSNYGQEGLEKNFLERADLLCGMSNRACSLLLQRYPHFRHKIARIPPVMMGVTPGDLAPNSRRRTEPVRITLFGFLRPSKGIDELLQALAFLQNRESLSTRAVVRIRGRMPEEYQRAKFDARIEKRIEEFGLRWLVDFEAGSLKEAGLSKLLQDTDILVIPNVSGSNDSTSLSLLRAMGWCVAVVASNTGAMPELIDHGKNGVLYPAGDPTALADGLDTLIKKSDVRMGLSRALRKRAVQEYAPDVVSDKMRELYLEVIHARHENRPVQLPDFARVEIEEEFTQRDMEQEAAENAEA